MTSSANQCPSCGTEQPKDYTGGLCTQCKTAQQSERSHISANTSSNLGRGPSETTHKYIPSADESTRSMVNADQGSSTRDVSGRKNALPSGTNVRSFGDYLLEKELGRGGMGVVYRARQVSLNRPVALKMVKAGLLADDAELRRFQNEAKAVALLDHPGIVPVYEVGEYEGQRYFSMKLIVGSNLAEKLASFQKNLKATVVLLIAMADAVQHAHMRGILHRDLKPANILIDVHGKPHITDFGLAKLMESDDELTASGAIMGTPAYMSPEQAEGRRGAMTLATDVYGLGAIFYALLTGKAPFRGDSLMETLDAVRNRPPEPPRKRNAEIPSDLELICLKCLEKNPADRYQTAGALADDLGRWAAGEPVSVRATGVVERIAKWARRKPTLAAAYFLGLLTVLLTGLGGLALVQWNAAARARDVAASAKVAAEKARDGEAAARTIAEQARDGEKQARAIAEQARDEIAEAREKLAGIEYGRTMEVCLQEWKDANLGTTLALLKATRPDFRGWEWRYLDRLCNSEQLTIPVDAQTASFSPDGTRVVTSSKDGTAKVWDARTGGEILTLKGHAAGVTSASFNPDGTRIVTGSEDTTGKVWDAKTGAELLTLKGHTGTVSSASFSPDGLRVVTASWDGTGKVWDAKTSVEVFTLTGQFNSAEFSRDGSRIVTASGDGTARIWDAATGVELHSINACSSRIQSASFSPDGSRIVTGSQDSTAKVWDLSTGTELLTIKGHTMDVLSASFSPDGSRVLTANPDGVKLWNARKSDAEPMTLKGHTGALLAATFSPDGLRVVTGGTDKTAKIWDARSGDEIRTLKGHTFAVRSASFSPDGSRVVTAGPDGTAKVWDSTSGVEVVTLKGHNGSVQSASFSRDGSRIITAGIDSTVRLWNVANAAEVLSFKGHNGGVSSAVFSLDGSQVVTASDDGTAIIWNAMTGVAIVTLKGHAGQVFSAEFCPDGSRVVTTGGDGSAKVWDAKSAAVLLTLKGHVEGAVSASFSPDGARIVTGSLDNRVKVWDAKTGAEVLTLKGHTFWVFSVSFSPDGSRILSASNDGTAKIWDATPIRR